jgi:hypothetical protein
MIRLFRKIRHKLLSEESYGMYILYASGEIVLVVVGILLALQIDNWHSNQTQENQNLSYENVLAVDLVQDTLMINQKLRFLVHDTTQLSTYINSMSSEEVTIDTLIQIARFEFNPWIYAQATFNNNTFTSLRSTGDFNYLNPWLQGKLLALNELHQKYYNSVQVDVRNYLDQTVYYSQKYPFNDKGHINPSSKLSTDIWQSAQYVELGAFLNGLIGIKFVTEYDAINKLLIIKEFTREILEKLDEDNFI